MASKDTWGKLSEVEQVIADALSERVKIVAPGPQPDGRSCPFCGQEVEIVEHQDTYSVRGCEHLVNGGGTGGLRSARLHLQSDRAWQRDEPWPWSEGWPVVGRLFFKWYGGVRWVCTLA